MTTQDIQKLAHSLQKATSAYHTQAQLVATAKRDLDKKRAELIRQGKAQGKNQQERDAWINGYLDHEEEVLAAREAGLTSARLELELARIDWDAMRYQLRLMEVNKAN